MNSMGLDFQAPSRKKTEAWKVLEVLAAHGYRFDSCGCGGPGHRPRTLKALKTFLKSEQNKDPKRAVVAHLLGE